MIMRPKFIKSVDESDVVSVRISLTNELMLDPRGESFKVMLSYAESKLDDLYDVHDGVVYSENSDDWNEELLYRVKNDLDYNFSRERILFYEKIAKYVLQEKAKQLDSEEQEELRKKNNEKKYTHTQINETNNSKDKREIYTGIAIGGAVVATIGLFTYKIITLFGVAGVAVGSYLLYKEKKDGINL